MLIGSYTAFSMIISDLLGIDMEKITILQSDTDVIPRGQGTRVKITPTAGSAVHVASETTDKAKELASHLLEANTDDIIIGEGAYTLLVYLPTL